MLENISYDELRDCQCYAKNVIDYYKNYNEGKLPMDATEAELAIKEYNGKYDDFMWLFGYAIDDYIDTIVNEIGYMVEEQEDSRVIKTKNKVIKKEINTVGDLKKLLDGFKDEVFINFGTEKLGFEVNSYSSDVLSLSLSSDDLKEYLEENDHS